MSTKILIDGSREGQTQFALLSENGLEDFEFESISKKNLKGNIYLGKVSRIEASLQAAFVEIGSEKNGFLAFGEIHPNYFQIPVADREALIKAEAEIEESHSNFQDNKNEEKENETEIEINNTQNDDSEKLDILNEQSNLPPTNNKRKISANLKRKLYRSYKIQEVIKTGQLILVQVEKEEKP